MFQHTTRSSSLSAIPSSSPSPSTRLMPLPTSPLSVPPPSTPPRRPDSNSSTPRPSTTGRYSSSPPSFRATEGTPRPESTRRTYARRNMSDMDKLLQILELIQSFQWNMATVLELLVTNRAAHRVRKAHASFLNFAYRDFPIDERFFSVIRSGRRKETIASIGWAAIMNSLHSELSILSQDYSFGTYSPTSEQSDYGSLSGLPIAKATMAIKAPRWCKLIGIVCANLPNGIRPASWFEPTVNVGKDITNEQLVIISLLCHCLKPRLSCNFQYIIGLYLYQGGARRRCIDTLSSLGLTCSYSTILRQADKISSEARRRIRQVGCQPTTIMTYDNYDFVVGRRDERIGDVATHRSITTALMFRGQGLGAIPLRQEMWQPKRHPFSMVALATSLHPTELDTKVCLFHIEGAIKVLYDSPQYKETNFPWVTDMPEVHRLEQFRTEYYPIKPIMMDESSTTNNIRIIEDIYAHQTTHDTTDVRFASELRLIGGDLKTWKRIESAKAYRSDVSEQHFDRFDWLLPCMGLWHLRFNMLQLIHAVHWGKVSPADPSTLQYFADRWGRSQVNKGNNFQALESLIINSYQSRIVGKWIRLIRTKNMLITTIDDTVRWFEGQPGNQNQTWKATLRRLVHELYSIPDTALGARPNQHLDQVYDNHQNFCTVVEVYLTLKYAIQHLDIGLLRYALRKTTVVFQHSTAATPHYAQALLRTLHMVDSPAATETLQNAILANSLVNLEGNRNLGFELDRLLELHNLQLKTFQRERSQFSKNSDQLLQNWALNVPYFERLKDTVEATVGHPSTGRHPHKHVAEDIWSMGYQLAIESMGRQENSDRFSINPTISLYHQGLHQLPSNVLKYNRATSSHYGALVTTDEDGNEVPPDPNELGITDLIDNVTPLPSPSITPVHIQRGDWSAEGEEESLFIE